MLKIYCRITGVLLLALAVMGIFNVGIPTALSLNEPAEIGLHLILGVFACAAGFTGGASSGLASLYARALGVVYIVLAILGFVIPDLIPSVLHLDPVCNFLHLILGLWGTFVGYFAPVAAPQPHVPVSAAGA
jgi:hypothetical protein